MTHCDWEQQFLENTSWVVGVGLDPTVKLRCLWLMGLTEDHRITVTMTTNV